MTLTDAVRERLTDDLVDWALMPTSPREARERILAALAPVLEQAQRELREMTELRDTHRRNEAQP
jgi:hypothetical protein